MPYRLTGSCLVLVFAVLLAPAATAAGDSAADLYQDGSALLERAEFDAAMKAYAAAARADPKNEQYRQQYALLRRTIQLRDGLDGLDDPPRWDQAALSLRTFYIDNRVYTEALAIDRERHARFGTTDTASALAETLLIQDMNEQTVHLLASLGERQSPRTIAQRGIAHARLDEIEAAQALLGRCAAPEDKPDPAFYFDLARLQALLGDEGQAAASLTRSFEQTPPGRLEAMKSYARTHEDLSGVVATRAFAVVWETPSQVKESSCSAGPSCSKCPSRTTCEGS